MVANEMPEYAASSRRHYRESNDGNQAGDPDKAIAVILKAVDADNAPSRSCAQSFWNCSLDIGSFCFNFSSAISMLSFRPIACAFLWSEQ